MHVLEVLLHDGQEGVPDLEVVLDEQGLLLLDDVHDLLQFALVYSEQEVQEEFGLGLGGTHYLVQLDHRLIGEVLLGLESEVLASHQQFLEVTVQLSLLVRLVGVQEVEGGLEYVVHLLADLVAHLPPQSRQIVVYFGDVADHPGVVGVEEYLLEYLQ